MAADPNMSRVGSASEPVDRRVSLASRTIWFVGIWFLSVAALGVVAFAIRWALKL